jgi:hypothetical protein
MSGHMVRSRDNVLWISIAALALHLAFAQRYGIFRDELYYLACAEHLDWGYVDQPPLIAAIAWFVRYVLGGSLMAMRLLPAIAAAATVWFTGRLARRMGGGTYAQALACFAVLTAPIYLVLQHWLTMNAFEPLLWLAAAWFALQAMTTQRGAYWIGFGVVVGLGLENKYTMALFAAAIVAGVLVTRERRWLATRWLWLGGVAALLLFLPNLVWLVRHGFPFLELMQNIRQTDRDVVRGPLEFVLDQMMIMGPAAAPLWIGGWWWLMRGERGSAWRVLGCAFVLLLASMIALKGKNYYVAPVYPMLFAAGGVALETWIRSRALRQTYAAIVVAIALVLLPLSLPVLPPETLIAYQHTLHIEPPKAENQDTGPLPQYFADEFGWEEMVRKVAVVYNSLPPDERLKTAIFANSYGQAGAIDFFGPKYGLPKAISNHQNYWIWGPRDYHGDTVIVLGSDGRGDRQHFATVEEVAFADHPYARRDEHYPILLCRRLSSDLQSRWPAMKKWN